MKYQDLYDEFIKLFPEDRDFFCEKEKETGAERTNGGTLCFSGKRLKRDHMTDSDRNR